eukprot:COSAG02_NODE_14798_length_1235_cov_1.446303_2_plen_366_part_00
MQRRHAVCHGIRGRSRLHCHSLCTSLIFCELYLPGAECSPGCDSNMLGDGYCDAPCDTPECYSDLIDCPGGGSGGGGGTCTYIGLYSCDGIQSGEWMGADTATVCNPSSDYYCDNGDHPSTACPVCSGASTCTFQGMYTCDDIATGGWNGDDTATVCDPSSLYLCDDGSHPSTACSVCDSGGTGGEIIYMGTYTCDTLEQYFEMLTMESMEQVCMTSRDNPNNNVYHCDAGAFAGLPFSDCCADACAPYTGTSSGTCTHMGWTCDDIGTGGWYGMDAATVCAPDVDGTLGIWYCDNGDHPSTACPVCGGDSGGAEIFCQPYGSCDDIASGGGMWMTADVSQVCDPMGAYVCLDGSRPADVCPICH